MDMSRHSQMRCQQRGISVDQVQLILAYGQQSAMPGGAWEYQLRKKDKDRLIAALKRLIQLVEKSVGKGVVISGDTEHVITTYHLWPNR
jgi:hypothetical protein